jgi:hypothetical protein
MTLRWALTNNLAKLIAVTKDKRRAASTCIRYSDGLGHILEKTGNRYPSLVFIHLLFTSTKCPFGIQS